MRLLVLVLLVGCTAAYPPPPQGPKGDPGRDGVPPVWTWVVSLSLIVTAAGLAWVYYKLGNLIDRNMFRIFSLEARLGMVETDVKKK